MLVCILGRLDVRGELRVLKVLITMRFFSSNKMDFLEMEYELMIGGNLFD